MKLPSSGEDLSRRQFLDEAPGQLLGYFASLWRGEARWFEVVQDMRDGGLWHVNLFAAADLGDIQRGRLIRRWQVRADSVQEIRASLRLPLRIQYRDGHREQGFEVEGGMS